ncbi:hypothetical protein ACEXQB_011395 [Herbiconiux sp. P18]|uniref:hypothetical protein n=1 Tax=Herbiconiux liangxiaofengii TaxID=3342795 RepID=UPI0035BB9BAE
MRAQTTMPLRTPRAAAARLAPPAVAVAIASALLTGAAPAAHAEMTDPPIQANVDWIPEPQVSFNVVGGIPAGLQGTWQLDRIDDTGFAYAPIRPGGFVSQGPVDAFNDYKGGGCYASGFVIRCPN